MKVLIAEDEEILYKVLQEKFEKEKFETKLATDGSMVLPLAKSFHPDIITLDLMMPKKTGWEVLAELKADPELKTIPVVVLSNFGQDDEIKKALTMGAVDYFVKAQHPINEVVDKVKQHMLVSK
ncbi:MAG: response regulator [Candidatus Magasanikbacteria bacterium]|nr:response regulator [Candidatus Magasanikbacteria bacterium]